MKKRSRSADRRRRHRIIRKKVRGSAARPRLAVFRSNRHIYGQLIDDDAGVTLASASSLDKDLGEPGSKTEAARKVGELLAKRAAGANLESAVLDRGGHRFHGRVAALTNGARAAGLRI